LNLFSTIKEPKQTMPATKEAGGKISRGSGAFFNSNDPTMHQTTTGLTKDRQSVQLLVTKNKT
jgi:hypothetical protein